jgi:hypothetical protein
VLRQEKLGKGGRDVTTTSETLRWSLVGIQSHPVEPGQQPEASLAWGGVSRTAKRRQPASTPSIEPREMLTRGEPSFSRTRGPRRHTVTAWCARSRRGQRTRHRRIEASQELGTPWTLRDLCPDGDPDHQPQARRLRVLDRREQNTGAVAVSRSECKRSDARRGSGNRSAS